MRLFPRSKFTVLLVIFMIYAYYAQYSDNKQISAEQSAKNKQQHQVTNMSTSVSELASPETETDTTLEEKVIGKIAKNPTGKVILEALVRKSFEDEHGTTLQAFAAGASGTFTIVDVLRGTGAPLNCGAKAVINYEGFLSNGLVFDTTISKEKTSPITIQLGSGQVIKGLEIGLLGMMEGGRRKISVAPQLAFDNPNFTNSLVQKGEVVSYDVELVAIKDGPYKTTDNIVEISHKNDSTVGAMCGDKVTMKYKITSTAGDFTGDASFTIGDGTVPIGFEFAAQSMTVGGTRTVQIPASLLKSAGKNSLSLPIKFNAGEVVEATIERVK